MSFWIIIIGIYAWNIIYWSLVQKIRVIIIKSTPLFLLLLSKFHWLIKKTFTFCCARFNILWSYWLISTWLHSERSCISYHHRLITSIGIFWQNLAKFHMHFI